MDQEVQRSFQLDGLVTIVDARLLSLYVGGSDRRSRTDRVRRRADRQQDRHGLAGRGRRDGALAAVGEQQRAHPPHALRRHPPRAAAEHRPPRHRPRARARHATREHPAAAAAPRRARRCARARAYAPTPTVKAKGWSLDIGDYPRALGWAAGAGEIALGTAGGVLQIRRASDGFALFNRKVHEAPVTTLAWHPTQARLATAGEDGAVAGLPAGRRRAASRWFAPAAGGRSSSPGAPRATCWRSRRAHTGFIFAPRRQAAGAAPRGGEHDHRPRLVARRRRHRVRVLRRRPPVRSRSRAARLRHLDAKGSMLSLAWSPDGKVVASGCQDNNVHLWRFPKAEDTVLPGVPLKPRALSFSDDSQLLATTDGPDVTVWNVADEAPRGTVPGAAGRSAQPGDRADVFAPGRAARDRLPRRRGARVDAARARSDGRLSAARQRRSRRWSGESPPRPTGTGARKPLLLAAATGVGLAGGVGGRPPGAGAIADAELAVAARARGRSRADAAQAALTWRRRRQRRRRVPPRPGRRSPRAWSRSRSCGRRCWACCSACRSSAR